MKLELPPEILRDELSAVVAATDKSNAAKPMLDLVYMEPDAKNIRFLASDGVASIDSYLKVTKEVKVEDGRAVCLPARKLLDLVKLMSGGKVSISIASDGNVTVKHGKATYRLRSIDGSRYPQVTDEFTEAFKIPTGETLRKFIKLTRGFIGEDDSRFAFSGGLLECEEGKLRMVGTDGARIAVAEHEHTDYDSLVPHSVLVPNRALSLLFSLASSTESVRVAFARDRMGTITKAKFRVGRRFLTTNLTSGTFPAWRQALTKTRLVETRMDRTELLNSLKRSMIVSDVRNRFLELRFTEDGVAIKTDGSDAGEEVLACDYTIGDAMPETGVGVDAHFVTQFLAVVPEVLTGDGVLLSYAGLGSFIEINPESADCDFRYLIAPVRI